MDAKRGSWTTDDPAYQDAIDDANDQMKPSTVSVFTIRYARIVLTTLRTQGCYRRKQDRLEIRQRHWSRLCGG